jgi:RNA polymerase sigma-70 factor (sigma-E family)
MASLARTLHERWIRRGAKATTGVGQRVLEGVEGLQPSDEAFSAFVLARQGELVHLGRALTGDRQLGEDLAQSALQQLWPHWPRVAAAGDPFPYAQRIMVNLCTSWRRRRWRLERPTASPPEVTGGDAMTAVDDHDALGGWLARLPARQRAVVVLRFVCDLNVAETAERLGCSSGTVKSQTTKALHNLRQADRALRFVTQEVAPS